MKVFQIAWAYGPILMLSLPLAANDHSFPETRLFQKALGLSPSVGVVSDVWGIQAGQAPQFLILEDVHEHGEAQAAIASAILYGRKQWKASTIFVEGASGAVERPAKPRTGAEWAVVRDPEKRLQLFGLESPSVYRQNLTAYQQVKKLRGAALEELHTTQLLRRAVGETDPALEARWALWERLLALKLRPSDYTQLLNTPFEKPNAPHLAEALGWAQRFYVLADARSSIFLEKARNVETEGPRVLVVGGFHTTEMVKRLREAGESYLVISPTITRPANDARYARRMDESVSALLGAAR